MKIKASKKMAAEIQKLNKNYNIKQIELSVEDFKKCVSFDIWANEIDFDYESNKFKVIKILYPFDYYAAPNYLTTSDLIKCYKASDRTYAGFMDEIKSCIEI